MKIFSLPIDACKFLYKMLMKLFYDLVYEDGKPSKGFIGFWICFAVIIDKFVKTGSDIPDNWLTLIMTLLAYNGSKKITKAYVGKKNAAAADVAADSEDPVN